jgi:putative Holliday junction resolvase
MQIQTILAFDFGTKQIGVAVGNSVIRQAQSLKTIQNKSLDETFKGIQQLVKEWEVTHLVVGLPTHPDGAEHDMTNRAKRFGNQLHGRLSLPVIWVDERYTSATVENKEGDIDSQSAVMILEQYFSESP